MRWLRLENTLGGYAQLLEQVFGEFGGIGLSCNGVGHAVEPGVALGVADLPARMELRNADRTEFLRIVDAARPASR